MAASLEWHRTSPTQPQTARTGRRCARRAIALAALLTIAAFPAPATAEPVDIRGFIYVTSSFGEDPVPPFRLRLGLEFRALEFFPPQGDLIQRYFQVSVPVDEADGVLDIVRAALPDPPAAGAVLNLSTRATWTAAALEDVPFICCPPPISRGTLELIASDAVLELMPFEGGGLAGSAPFVLNGVIEAFDVTTGAPLFEQHIRGRGTAQFVIDPSSPEHFAYFYDIVPIPEPAILLLFGLGLGAVAVQRDRVRRRRPSA